MDENAIQGINFYYFSGTGNTYLIVNQMKEVFESNNIPVRLHPIEKDPPVSIEENQLIGLAFPVVAFSTFGFVRRFINNMPPGNGTSIFMVDTLGMISGGMVGPLKRVVKKKGYNPIGAKEIKMPENFYPSKVSPEKNTARIDRGLESARKYAVEIISGLSHWPRVPLLSDIIWTISGSRPLKIFFHKMGEKITIDQDKCTLCGTCIKLCPVDNIYRKEDRILLHRHCEQCMRCLSFCPESAITVPGKNFTPHKAVEAEKLLADNQQ